MNAAESRTAGEEKPDRGALAALLVAGAVAVAPHALELPLWVVGVFLAGGLWRYGAATRGWYRPGRTARWLLLAVVVAATFRQYHTLLGRDPGLALLIGLLGLKFLELGRLRDYMLSAFLFYLVTLGGFLYEQTLPLGVYAVVSALAITAALIRLTQPRGLGIADNLRLAATLLAKAVPLMLILYVLFPRIQGTLWALPTERGTALSGLTDTMRPGSIHQLTESGDVAFRVSFEHKPPPPPELYWRALVLWNTDGREWSRGSPPAGAHDKLEPLGEPVRYEIVQEPTQHGWMMALDLPAAAPANAVERTGFTLESRDPSRERSRYTLTSYTHYRTAGLSDAEREAALQLPERLSPRVRALADEWRRADREPGAIAQAALDYFHRENFVYTLNPPPLGDDPVDQFLFSARRGFCEHYAAAFVTLMRAAGVPARVVVGYQGGEFNTAGNYLIVRQSDAHAWAEVWLPQRGWTRVDPTAAVAPERIELGMDAVRRLAAQGTAFGVLPEAEVLRDIRLGWLERAWNYSRLYWDLVNMTWYRWVADYGPERQERLLARLGLDQLSGRGLLMLAAASILALLGGYGLWLRRERPRIDPVQVQYLRFCRKLARIGLHRAPQEGARDFARRCVERRPDLASAVERITGRYELLRYGENDSRDEIRRLKRDVVDFRPRKLAA